MIELTEETYKQETATGKVLVDFYAPWCGVCKMLKPKLEELKSVKVCMINVDKWPKVAVKHGISNLPTLILYQDGKEQKRGTFDLLKDIHEKVDEKETYNVVQEFVKDDKIIKAISVSYSDFEKAVQQFHLIEQSLEENGYDLDDDTSNYTIEEVHNGNFFNNATNDTTTIRIFLEESK